MPKMPKEVPAKLPPIKKSKPDPILAARPVIYPDLKAFFCCLGEKPPITEEKAKKLLGWETRKEHEERAKTDPEAGEFVKHLKDEEGNDVTLHNADRNRPFKEDHARSLGQDVLKRNWAGPTCMPGETVNGESIIISRTGQVKSAVHRLVGFVLACQLWRKQNVKWLELWPEAPILESLVVTGTSDDPRITQTLDNTMPRSLADAFYTGELFKDLMPQERKECSRYGEKAVDLLWARTGAGGVEGRAKVYQTHSESMEFLARHGRLKRCIKHLFEENRSTGKTPRGLSSLRLSPGQCSAMMYLMACSSDDGDQYRIMDVKGERKLEFGLWEEAAKFWTELAKGPKGELKELADSLNHLLDVDSMTGGREVEKHCMIAKAWAVFADGRQVKKADVALKYLTNEDGTQDLKADELVGFGGIDLGPSKRTAKEDEEDAKDLASEEETKAAKRAAAAEKLLAIKNGKGKDAPVKPDFSKLAEQVKADKEAAAAKPAPKSFSDELDDLREENGGAMLILRMGGPGSNFCCWGDDAVEASKILKLSTKISMELPKMEIQAAKLADAKKRLVTAGYKVAVIEEPTKHEAKAKSAK